MQWLNNAWFVGIGCGILSGIIVTWLSRVLFSRRDDREKLERISTANREILYAVRPGIAEGAVPTAEVLESLISATARKYKLLSKELYAPREILDDLVKEVMDSSFISASAKADFCSKLSAALRPGIEIVELEFKAETLQSEFRRQYRATTLSWMSATIGLMTGLMTAAASLMATKGSLFPKSGIPAIILPTIVATMSLLLVMVTFTIFRSSRAADQSKTIKEQVSQPEDHEA